jgi:hypothetical protein
MEIGIQKPWRWELLMKHDGHWTIFTTDFGAKLDTRIAFFSPFE